MEKLHLNVPINEVELSKRSSIGSFVSGSDSDEEEAGNVPQYTHPELKNHSYIFQNWTISNRCYLQSKGYSTYHPMVKKYVQLPTEK